MNKAVNRLRLFFCTFSGEDNYIINRCEPNIQISFALIGLFVIVIFIGSWLSADLFMDYLFEGKEWVSAFVGIVWALLFTNLYLLLLYTISPTLLPVANKKKKRNRKEKFAPEETTKLASAFTPSFILRIAFILLLAIIIVQPLNVRLFSPSLKVTNGYADSLRQILKGYPRAWIITLTGCLILILPIYWKYAIRNRGGFYEKKKRIENKFIYDNYTDFKEQYATLLNSKMNDYNMEKWKNVMPFLTELQKFNPEKHDQYLERLKSEMQIETISKYEYWADPPFRTKRKESSRNVSSEEDFLKNIYSENI